jgi:hypothetical protein
MPFKPRRRASGAGKRWSADAVAMSATDLRIISRAADGLPPSACQVGLQPASVSAAAGVGRCGRLPAEALGRERLHSAAGVGAGERRPPRSAGVIGSMAASSRTRGMLRTVLAATVLTSASSLVAPLQRAPRPTALCATQLEAFLEGRPGAARFYECVGEGCLTSRPVDEPEKLTEGEQKTMSEVVDYLHAELMKLSPMADYVPEEDDIGDTMDDFIEEGRKMLSISQSTVVRGADDEAVADGVWDALGHLFSEEQPNTGLLVALPEYAGDATIFVRDEVVKPLELMGFGDRVETSSYRVSSGAPCPAFRVLVSPREVPSDGMPSENDPMSLFGN